MRNVPGGICTILSSGDTDLFMPTSAQLHDIVENNVISVSTVSVTLAVPLGNIFPSVLRIADQDAAQKVSTYIKLRTLPAIGTDHVTHMGSSEGGVRSLLPNTGQRAFVDIAKRDVLHRSFNPVNHMHCIRYR